EMHRAMHQWTRDLNRVYSEQPALYEVDYEPRGFQWIEANDVEQSVFTYLRFADDPTDFVVVAANFTPVPRWNYRIGVPEAGFYTELINSDSAHYGGGNIGNNGGLHTDSIPWHRWGQSLNLTIPPLGIVILKVVKD
ncbi:MAG: alpha amylase C-terminal domain-containing protein, partial [Anaerolineae bacterium]|nr:alpha amylase C-terminal domain-containing protein [Anaerolineae bacterium]